MSVSYKQVTCVLCTNFCPKGVPGESKLELDILDIFVRTIFVRNYEKKTLWVKVGILGFSPV